jgi:hypothetical protein
MMNSFPIFWVKTRKEFTSLNSPNLLNSQVESYVLCFRRIHQFSCYAIDQDNKYTHTSRGSEKLRSDLFEHHKILNSMLLLVFALNHQKRRNRDIPQGWIITSEQHKHKNSRKWISRGTNTLIYVRR